MSDHVNYNPFAGLFSTIDDAVLYSIQASEASNGKNEKQCIEENHDKDKELLTNEVSDEYQVKLRKAKLMADVFGLILNSNEIIKIHKDLVSVAADSIEDAIFERIVMPSPKINLIQNEHSNSFDSHVVETQVIFYLYESFRRLKNYEDNKELFDYIDNLKLIVLRHVGIALQEPNLFDDQDVYYQFVSLFMEDSADLSEFFKGLVSEICSSNEDTFEEVIKISFTPILNIIHQEAAQSTLVGFREHWFTILNMFCNHESLAKLLLEYNKPKSNQGKDYEKTLFGAFFCLNCLSKAVNPRTDFFSKSFEPSDPVRSNIWVALDALTDSVEHIFHSLLKLSPEIRHMTLQWIGDCLHANASRGKLWNSHNEINFGPSLNASDGFMLNFGGMLLQLCQPFCVQAKEMKFPKIDPTYCAAEPADEDESRNRGLHIKGLSQETCLIPTPEGQVRPVSKLFSFTTECFFLTHRALDLGYRIVIEKLQRAQQDLSLVQQRFQDSRDAPINRSFNRMIAQQMEVEMTKYLTLKASLCPPKMLNNLAKFYATTAHWIIQVNLDNVYELHGEDSHDDYIPKLHRHLNFPLSEKVPITLRCIPEFIVEHTVGFLCVLREFSTDTFEEQGETFLNPIMTELILLMDEHRLYNPHLRARLAEGLGALLPPSDEDLPLRAFHRQQLFKTHKHVHQIVAQLLQVFVSIEMTGQSVQFEQKFNYRRPMYTIMHYLWELPGHRKKFIALAKDAEANMEAVRPPLFLRFINLLMNDAVFLLDEALSNMAQLRKMIQARDNGEWDKLPPNERIQQRNFLHHVGTIAQFDNILGRKTIQTIKMLTSEIKSIFCHPTMVDRIASMLNYLLLQLVGPDKNKLKVDDQDEYGFEPANLVLDICKIYVNLSENKSFTLAVSQDGRSYSPKLFKSADQVLLRIGGFDILGELNQFAKNVEKAATIKRKEDEILTEAPEEFLDPIMSTLMIDPVILPSSKITIDRRTIARHLLSDQTDPFNRSPLTMDMIKPNTELKNKIQQWISNKKAENLLQIL
ncbi:PREDICTED: ubiquitin conjugation factor E4 A [Polistes canadensis]|uniref:ubiquitin conjugation factor E4 A n=1 Tax=Polistes canadensis TaxID=91411 RepID=UPI000718EDB1|nr:PREDICTED: ubiquitin conjugation factor E4 A [Polistes canadensis]